MPDVPDVPCPVCNFDSLRCLGGRVFCRTDNYALILKERQNDLDYVRETLAQVYRVARIYFSCLVV